MKKQYHNNSAFCLLPSALLTIVLWLCSSAGTFLFAEDVNIKITANRNQIYIGESFILEITVSGSMGPAEVDFSKIKNANIRSLGSRNISNYSITIINGKMTKEGFTGFVSSYEVTPLAAGKLQTGPIDVKIGGKTITDTGPLVTVTDIEKQDRVILSVTASRETALIEEPFEVTINLKIKCMTGDGAGFEPLFPDAPPSLSIPWLDQEMKGLAGPDIRQLLTGLLASHWNQPGITINKYTLSSDPFDISSMFSHEPRKAKFSLPGQAIQFNGQPYQEYNLQFNYVPKDDGNYVFGPIIFKGGVPERLDEHGRAVGANIFAVGPACTVRVIPPPDEGRPESYSGAIGSNLAAKAALDTTNCNLGDPLTLTLTVAGQVKLDKVLPPKLSLQTNILQNFTVYDNTVQSVKKNSCNQYLYTIRPTQAGNLIFPPIETAYYDVVGRGYKKIFTAPIALQVRRGTEVTEAQVIGQTNRASLKEEADIRKQAPAPIRLDNIGAQPASLLGDFRTAAVAGAGPFLYLVMVLAGFIHKSSRKIKRSRHRSSAKDRARQRLKTAAAADRKDHPQAAALICEAVRKYLGERLERDTSSLIPSEVVRLLMETGLSAALAEKFGALYEKYFNACFANAPLHGVLKDDCHAFQGLIRQIEAELNRKSKQRKTAGKKYLPILFFFAVLLGGNSLALDSSERIFIWNEANAVMQNAKAPADYLAAARIYQRLIDDGVRNGPLFYNIGTALLSAERNEPALDAFERAEQYLGKQTDIEHNLKIAYAKKMKSKTAETPWYRLAAFWHFYLSCPQRTGITAGAFLVFWLALVLRRLGIKRMTNVFVFCSLLIFILFATSVAASWQMENTAPRYNLNARPVIAPINSAAAPRQAIDFRDNPAA